MCTTMVMQQSVEWNQDNDPSTTRHVDGEGRDEGCGLVVV